MNVLDLHSGSKLCEKAINFAFILLLRSQNVAVVDYRKEIIALKSCKCGKDGPFESLFILLAKISIFMDAVYYAAASSWFLDFFKNQTSVLRLYSEKKSLNKNNTIIWFKLGVMIYASPSLRYWSG